MNSNGTFDIKITIEAELWGHDEYDLAVSIYANDDHIDSRAFTFDELIDDILARITGGDCSEEEALEWKGKITASLRRGLEKLEGP